MGILQLLLIAGFAAASSLACLCMPDHPQKQFCDAHYAINASVVSKTELPPMYVGMPGEQVYTLRVTEIYKGQANVKTDYANRVKLYTPPAGISCAVKLQLGQQYVLFGKTMRGKLYHRFCDWRKKSAALTSEQLLGISSLYSRGCVCSIGFCFSSKCRNLLPGCEASAKDYSYVNHECRANYQRCESIVNNRGEAQCGWTGSRMCLKDNAFLP